MSFSDDLLLILRSRSGDYGLLRKRVGEYMGTGAGCSDDGYVKRNYNVNIKDETIRMTLYRLKKHGFIKNENKIWLITQKGLTFLKLSKNKKIFKSINKINKKEKILIIFDIPEKDRVKRNWLRSILISLDFKILQKSAWLGPSPLPKSFINFLKNNRIIKYIKFLKI